VVGIPGKVVKIGSERVADMSQKLPDPMLEYCTQLQTRIEELERQVQRLEGESGESAEKSE
jgi:polyhydroxyalkanoate synthesis regulator phasin